MAGLLIVTVAMGGCAQSRWIDQWRRMDGALRTADAPPIDAHAPVVQLVGNRGFRFASRFAVVAGQLRDPLLAARLRVAGPLHVQCLSAPEECSGVVGVAGEEVRYLLVLRGLTTRISALKPLYLETPERQAVARVGPFPSGFHLDTGLGATIRTDGEATHCVWAEAQTLMEGELRRLAGDVVHQRVTNDEAQKIAERLSEGRSGGSDLCGGGRNGRRSAADR
ncbi:MAG TPA: hypothetical protein VM364_03700 [Vicinamibacterales bacterium]|nr:hypothetical protein [Vicinamibacterales bacterium]